MVSGRRTVFKSGGDYGLLSSAPDSTERSLDSATTALLELVADP